MKFEVVRCPLCASSEDRPLLQISSRRIVRCQECSLIYRNPRPTTTDLAPAYAQDSIDVLREERVGGRRSQQFRRFFDSFPERPGRLLDIGCGSGLFLKMAEERGWEAVGVDLNAQAVAYAKTHRHVNAACGNLRDLHFPEGSFDLVTLWNVLDHTPDPLDVLAEIHRLLKENGYVFIRTPNAVWQYLSFRIAKFLKPLGWEKLFDGRPYSTFIFHLTNFSRATLRVLLNHSGFVPLSIRNSPPIPGDPYLGLDQSGEQLVALIKRAVHGAAQAVAFLSGCRLLIGPSLEVWGRRGQMHDCLVGTNKKQSKATNRRSSFHAA